MSEKIESNYDSLEDTMAHIETVREYIEQVKTNLTIRGVAHDASSLVEPEKSFYDKYRPLLSSLEYNSPAYLAALEEFKPAIQHHYDNNSHHPEHFKHFECGACFKHFSEEPENSHCDRCGYSVFEQYTGVNGMSLLDVLEMLIDWLAAIARKGTDEDVLDNFDRTRKRFKISPQLADIIKNTFIEMGWTNQAELRS